MASGLWYSPLLFGTLYAKLRGADPGPMSPGEIVVELLRTLIIAYVFAHCVALFGVRDWDRALRFSIWVWIGFPTMILLGSVAHENVPLQLAAIHAGDWLVKILASSLTGRSGRWAPVELRQRGRRRLERQPSSDIVAVEWGIGLGRRRTGIGTPIWL